MSQISQTGIIGNQRTRRFKTYVTLSQMGSAASIYGGLLAISAKVSPATGGTSCPEGTRVGDGELLRIMLRQADCCGLQINTCYLAVRAFAGNRQSNRAGAGA
jgi:hypothetical protein